MVSVVCTRRDVVMQSSEVQIEWKKGVPIATVYVAVDMYMHMATMVPSFRVNL